MLILYGPFLATLAFGTVLLFRTPTFVSSIGLGILFFTEISVAVVFYSSVTLMVHGKLIVFVLPVVVMTVFSNVVGAFCAFHLTRPSVDVPPPVEQAAKPKQAAERECIICFSDTPTHACLPCGHLCLCCDCIIDRGASWSQCPLCQGPTTGTVRIFQS
mmetsp:Transcript_80641/g.160195  ORF Transcript_80641/g.160195 Transcript_80641/m.160195 type:complete len:159 (-) Transcript_80641:446-922(-)